MSSIQSYCRLCGALKSCDKLLNLVEDLDSDAREEIARKLHRLNAIVDFTSTILPQTVCLVCLTDLERAFDFVFNVEKVQAELCDILSAKIKEDDGWVSSEGSISEPEIEVQCKVDSDSDEIDVLANQPLPSSVTSIDEIGLKYNVQNKKLMKKSESPEPETSKEIEKLLFNSKEQPLEFSENSSETTEEPQTTESDTLPHQEGAWKHYKWMCRICDTEFATREELNSHSIQFHDFCNPYRCTDCRLRVSSLKRFLIHIKTHPERKNLKYSCYVCFKQYSSSQEVLSHIKMKHNLHSKHFCEGCHAVFNNETELNKHTNTYFKSVRQCLFKPLIDQTDSLTCLICQKTLKTKCSLNTHLLTHMDRERNHTCDTCGQRFYGKAELKSHAVTHSDARPFQCEICKAKFKTRATLRSHVGTHNATTPFECKDCGRSFRHKKLLNSHRSSMHSSKQRPFVCKYCSKTFQHRHHLKVHLRQHTGVRPYSCSICDRDFVNWGNHSKHMKTRHGVEIAKKKLTSEGMLPIDTATGQPVIPKKTEEMMQWERQFMQPMRRGKVKKTVVSKTTKTENNKNSN